MTGGIARFAVLWASFFVPAAQAQSYPTKPVRLVVGFAAGGSIDLTARLLAQELNKSLGQPFIVDNRAGAAGNIAAAYVAKAPPDGYTLLFSSNTPLAAGLVIYKKLPYDGRRDFAPIVLTVFQPNVLTVHPSVPAKSVKQLIALAKAHPGKLHFGTTGPGGGHYMRGQMFMMYTGVDLTPVTYKGGAPAQIAQLSGEIEVMFDTVPTTIDQIKSGKVRALAVLQPNRVQKLADVPTMEELGFKGYDSRGWMAFAAPAGTPREIVVKLNAAVNDALRSDLRHRLDDLGLEPAGGTIDEFLAFIQREIELTARTVKAAGMPLL
jgi:tripartite-type tricarboxylate transporter receptor subunit TctC